MISIKGMRSACVVRMKQAATLCGLMALAAISANAVEVAPATGSGAHADTFHAPDSGATFILLGTVCVSLFAFRKFARRSKASIGA